MVRIKNRYIVAQIVPKTPMRSLKLNEYTLNKFILSNVQKYYGDYGLGVIEQGFRIKYCNELTKIVILRCRHQHHRFLTSTLPFITLIGNIEAKFRTLYTGATIMQCNKFIIKHQQQFLSRTINKIPSAKERQDLIKAVLEFDLET